MATKFDRFLSGGSNWASRLGPAQGVNYFSGGDRETSLPVSGPGNLIEEGTLEPAQRPVPIESFRGSDGGGGAPQGPGRDLTQNPLGPTELAFAQALSGGLGLFGPAGSIAGQAIGFNLGKDVATNPTVAGNANTDASGSMAGRAGYLSGMGASATEAARGALATSALGRALGMSTEGIPGMHTAQNFGFQTTAGFRGLGHTGYLSPEQLAEINSQTISNEEAATQTANETNTAGGGQVSGGWGSDGSFNGAGYDPGPTGPSGGYDVGDNGAGGYALADGGMVGLAEPMFGNNNSPRTLTQIGFAEGGGIGIQTPQAGNSADMINLRVTEMMRNPQVQQMVQQVVGSAMASGELTPQELVTLGRIAEASIHNPALYPQLRQFAIQQGMAPLPPAFDQRVIMVLMVASRMMGGAGAPITGTPAGQVPPTSQAQMINPTGAPDGGMLHGPGTGRSDSIGTQNMSTGGPVKVSNGEYVIPAHVVRAKGQDFFDKMLRQYAPLTPEA